MAKLNPALALLVFMAGAIIMTLELAASRLIAPYLGSSLYVWTALLAVILASLSAGYILGGKIADCHPSKDFLARIVSVSALLVLLPALIQFPLLSSLAKQSLDLRLLALIASSILFTPATFMLGMISPYVIRLSLNSALEGGECSGFIFALSTVGSIFGTVITGFYLFAAIGTLQIILLSSSILAVLSFVVSRSGALVFRLLVLLFVAIISLVFPRFNQLVQPLNTSILDTSYQRVHVQDQTLGKELIRRLITDPLGDQSAMQISKPAALIVEYTKYFNLGMALKDKTASVLLLGGGAYSFPKFVLQYYPNTSLDVVEIDPGITKVAEKYFNFKANDAIKIFHQDARSFVNNTSKKYDLIILDAFASSPTVPFYLVTDQFFADLSELLNPNGALIINFLASITGETSAFTQALHKTVKTHFNSQKLFLVNSKDLPERSQNVILFASNDLSAPYFEKLDSKLMYIRDHLWHSAIDTQYQAFSDNFAPVEHYLEPVFKALRAISGPLRPPQDAVQHP